MSITAISTNGTKVSARNSASVSGNGNSEQIFMFKNSFQSDRLKKKNNYKKNLEQAKNENRLEYSKEEKFFFGTCYAYIHKPSFFFHFRVVIK